jgi:hypothetical protein
MGMKHLRNALLACLFLTRVGHAIVIEDTHLLFGAASGLGNYGATAFPQPGPVPGNQGWSTIYFQFIDVSLNEGSIRAAGGTLGGVQGSWYRVRAGDILSAATIASNKFLDLNVARAVNSPDFFLGVDLNTNIADPNAPHAYGWVHVLRNENTFVLEGVDSAIAYHNSGIIVGTLTEVPEPASWILFSLASMGLLCRVRRFPHLVEWRA